MLKNKILLFTFLCFIIQRSRYKVIGYKAEYVVAQHFIAEGYMILESNFQIQGGEIDIIMRKDQSLYFIEVKVVDGLDELVGHITHRKLLALRRSIDQYLHRKRIQDLSVRLLFVYVKNYAIYSIHEFE